MRQWIGGWDIGKGRGLIEKLISPCLFSFTLTQEMLQRMIYLPKRAILLLTNRQSQVSTLVGKAHHIVLNEASGKTENHKTKITSRFQFSAK
jgi:hypothetical protein